MIETPITTTLNTTTFTLVELGATQSCGSASFWTEDGTAFYISDTEAGTVSVLTLADQAINIDLKKAKGDPLLYAKASAGAPNLATLISR